MSVSAQATLQPLSGMILSVLWRVRCRRCSVTGGESRLLQDHHVGRLCYVTSALLGSHPPMHPVTARDV